MLQEYYLGYYNVDHQDIFTNADGHQVLKVSFLQGLVFRAMCRFE